MTSGSSQAVSNNEPRLGVIHLMIWTLGCALGIHTYQRLTPELNEKFWAFGQVYIGVMGVAFGTIITCVGVLAHHRWRGEKRLPSLPGHWLLLFGLAAALANGLAIAVAVAVAHCGGHPDQWFLAYLAAFSVADSPNLVGIYHQAVGWGLGAVAALAFFWHLRHRIPSHWLVAFFVFLLASATLSGGYIISDIHCFFAADWAGMNAWCRRAVHLYAAFIALCVIVILLALIQDARRHRGTDWLHWTGIVTWLSIAMMQTATYIRFIMYV